MRRSGDMRIVNLSYHIPGATHPDTAALQRADERTRRYAERSPAQSAGRNQDRGRHRRRQRRVSRQRHWPSLLLIAPKDADIAKAEAELLRIAEGVATTPITPTEVDRTPSNASRTTYERGFSDVNGVAMSLTEAVAGGDWRLYFLQRDRVAAVTVDDVNRVAKTYLKPSNRTIGRFIPTDNADRAQIAAAPPAADALEGLRRQSRRRRRRNLRRRATPISLRAPQTFRHRRDIESLAAAEGHPRRRGDGQRDIPVRRYRGAQACARRARLTQSGRC